MTRDEVADEWDLKPVDLEVCRDKEAVGHLSHRRVKLPHFVEEAVHAAGGVACTFNAQLRGS